MDKVSRLCRCRTYPRGRPVRHSLCLLVNIETFKSSGIFNSRRETSFWASLPLAVIARDPKFSALFPADGDKQHCDTLLRALTLVSILTALSYAPTWWGKYQSAPARLEVRESKADWATTAAASSNGSIALGVVFTHSAPVAERSPWDFLFGPMGPGLSPDERDSLEPEVDGAAWSIAEHVDDETRRVNLMGAIARTNVRRTVSLFRLDLHVVFFADTRNALRSGPLDRRARHGHGTITHLVRVRRSRDPRRVHVSERQARHGNRVWHRSDARLWLRRRGSESVGHKYNGDDVLRRCLDRSRYGKEYGKRRFLKSGETEYPNRSRSLFTLVDPHRAPRVYRRVRYLLRRPSQSRQEPSCFVRPGCRFPLGQLTWLPRRQHTVWYKISCSS